MKVDKIDPQAEGKKEESDKLKNLIKDAKSTSELAGIEALFSNLSEYIRKILEKILNDKIVNISTKEQLIPQSKSEYNSNSSVDEQGKKKEKEKEGEKEKEVSPILQPTFFDKIIEAVVKIVSPEEAPKIEDVKLVSDSQALVVRHPKFVEDQKEKMPKEFHYTNQPENRDLFSKEGAIRKDESITSILGLKPDATSEEVRKAYKKSGLKYHPDKNMSRADAARDVMSGISEAYSRHNSCVLVEENWGSTQTHEQIISSGKKTPLLMIKDAAESDLQASALASKGNKEKDSADFRRNSESDPISVTEVDRINNKFPPEVIAAAKEVSKALINNGSSVGGDNVGKGVKSSISKSSSMHDID